MATGVTPDFPGFLDAQHRMAEAFGTTVTWQFPGSPGYPPGTPIDPETGRPYDPDIDPTSGGEVGTTVETLAQVANPELTDTRLALQDFIEAAIGSVEVGKLMLSVEADVWEANSLDDAFRFVVNGEEYDIVRHDEDRIADEQVHRHVVTGQQR